jgi:hypothetical protein
MDHFETADSRHVKVEEDQVGPDACDLGQGVAAVVGFGDDFDIREAGQFLPEYLTRDRLVIDDQRPDTGRSHHFELSRNGLPTQKYVTKGMNLAADGQKSAMNGAPDSSSQARYRSLSRSS